MNSISGEIDCHVEEAGETDLPWVQEIMVQCISDTVSPGDIVRIGRERIRDIALSEFQRFSNPLTGPNVVLVAKSSTNDRLGMVSIVTSYDANSGEFIGWIPCLFVDPQHRGKGLGRRLMDEAERWAKSKSFRKIALTVNPANEKAMSLYERSGFNVANVGMTKLI